MLRDAHADAALHARSIFGAGEVGLDADRRSAAASTYKVAVLLEVACQTAEGRIGAADRIRVPSDRRTTGPTGISILNDDVEMSVRDLAMLMIHVSDNTATDVLHELVGHEAVTARLRALGLTDTSFELDCHHLIAALLDELGDDRDALTPEELAERFRRSPSLRGERGNTTTPRDMTSLLSAVWRDEAGPPEACSEVRRVMGHQFAPHRLSTAYPNGPSVSGKTGTLFGGIRSEVGVVDFGGGEAYAVAVYLRGHRVARRDPDADRAIGRVARLAIDAIREAR
ncbi:serine hydrolase [Actinopolymorpha cephalotaxi]|uniref:Beta-lactamase class A n=1 Tax=Actinopolymorpha cephalotaxi TaxID=504797 RepID=A0ABX2S0U0_9ACTN|nr:serine hydrolase [Actinopolymorpha cephalotaxi]NYH82002.1 beta-lactamase class A [Actinopolymorpha cephalotaxi]